MLIVCGGFSTNPEFDRLGGCWGVRLKAGNGKLQHIGRHDDDV